MTAVPPRRRDLGGCIGKRETQRSGHANPHNASKVDDGPAILPRQPHDVGGLEVAVDVPRRMHVGHAA